MAKYDFDQLIPRRGTNSVKWDEEPAADILPMWVADMDFRTAPCVVEALRRRVEHGVYGYATVPESYYGAVTSWFARRHGWAPGADWILPVTGVIPALSAILRALTRPGDRVLVLTPVYNHFFIAIDNSGCSAAECELTYSVLLSRYFHRVPSLITVEVCEFCSSACTTARPAKDGTAFTVAPAANRIARAVIPILVVRFFMIRLLMRIYV